MTQAVDATSSTNEASAKSALSMAISSVQADFFAEVWTNNASATFDEVCNTEAVQVYMGKDDDGNEYGAEIGEWSSGEAVCTVTYKGETYTCTLALTSSKTGASIGDWSKSSGSSSSGSNVETISTETSFVGYFADVDDNGTVDGVIYADLMFSKNGTCGSNGYGPWSYTAISTSKEYYISQESYIDTYFGTKPVISPVDKDSTEEDRFYVMALSNYTGGSRTTFYWDYNGSRARFVYSSTYIATTGDDFGKGYSNTSALMNYTNYWSTYDIWYYISNDFENGWFVPSKSEWACFGSALNLISNGDSGSYGLSTRYWSSSMYSNSSAYHAWSIFNRNDA